jgi:hypothetical protein
MSTAVAVLNKKVFPDSGAVDFDFHSSMKLKNYQLSSRSGLLHDRCNHVGGGCCCQNERRGGEIALLCQCVACAVGRGWRGGRF